MFNFLFGSNDKKQKDSSKFIQVNSPKKEVFLVVHKNTHESIGIFDDLVKAKEVGRKSTYCNCMIYKFTLNGDCKYLNSPVYEDK